MPKTSGLKDLLVSSMVENYFSTSEDGSTAQENCNFDEQELSDSDKSDTPPPTADLQIESPLFTTDCESDTPPPTADLQMESPLFTTDCESDTPPPTADLQIESPLFTTDCERPHNNYYIGAGILNLGNTCFLNSVLQCFTHTVPLLSAIISFNHKTPCEDFSQGSFCVLCALCQHIEYSVVNHAGEVVRRVEIADNLNYFSPYFKKYQEEDAHEFLQCFLDKLESCCDDLMRKDDGASGSGKNNIVKEVFGGRNVSSIRCCNCGYYSNTYESSIDYSLEIDMSLTIYDSLDSFTKIERIEDTDTKFTCDGCKQSVSVEKRIMFDQAPSVVVFHLKRFKNNGQVLEKIDKFIDFPLKLDLRPYTTAADYRDPVNLKYDLYAIVVHIELSFDCGHYYCFIRSTGDLWFMIDDSKVMRVPEDYVLSQKAYLLFYAKQDTLSFSSFVENIVKE